MSAIAIQWISSGYASVPRRDLPMATTAMNIVQRLGGPTLTTLRATFLGWRLARIPPGGSMGNAFSAAFALLRALHALALAATLKLPRSMATVEAEAGGQGR